MNKKATGILLFEDGKSVFCEIHRSWVNIIDNESALNIVINTMEIPLNILFCYMPFSKMIEDLLIGK